MQTTQKALIAVGLLAMTMTMVAVAPATSAELVMFEARGCTWCRTWHEVIGPIYPLTDEGRAAPLRRVDKDEPRPADLTQIGGIRFTPTFVLVDGGREVGRITGYPGENFFWGLLDRIIAKVKIADDSGS